MVFKVGFLGLGFFGFKVFRVYGFQGLGFLGFRVFKVYGF